MAEKGIDRRIQRTRQLLQDSLLALILEKGYDAITVQDVIDHANVGRSTFYAHFQDKEDLLHSTFDHLRAAFRQHLAQEPVMNNSPWALSLAIFRHAQEQRLIYKALAGRQGGNIALAYGQKFLFQELHEHLKQVLPKQKIPPEIVAHYITSSFVALLTWWLDSETPYSAEQINEFYRQLVQPGIEVLF